MRQLAKSAFSLGWALSLLGAKQAYGVVAEGKRGQENLLGPVTQAAVGQLDESMKRIHRSAENMGSRVVEMAFSLLNPVRWMNLQSWNVWNSGANGGVGASGSVPDSAAEESQESCHSEPSGGNSNDTSTFDDNPSSGWGPMPGDQSMAGR
jgi:hypothetical protein